MRFSVWELLLVLVIVLVLFGGSRLRNLGSDLGSAIRGFRDSMKEGAKPETAEENPKKLEPPDSQAHSSSSATAAAHDPLAKDRDKV
ncbi:MAG: twin-arginine translocase TatA/TatE family subunit [Candidatus Competibacteraceae bacterium]|nr:twin-arginine translocase TatA/TatE family subunit [Candidatus Competibacteraceae bacterium]